MDISRDMFIKLDNKEEYKEEIVRVSMTYWADSWRRLKKKQGGNDIHYYFKCADIDVYFCTYAIPI